MNARLATMLATAVVLLSGCTGADAPALPKPSPTTQPTHSPPATPAAPSVAPAAATLGPRASLRFVTSIASPVFWRIEEGDTGGSIDASGLYRVGVEGIFHVRATSVADASQTAVATVTVVSAGFRELDPMSFPRCFHTATLLPSGEVLIAGYGEPVELFDPRSERFSPASRSPTQRDGASATLLPDGRVLFAGGVATRGIARRVLDTAELYDPASGASVPTGNLINARWGQTATVLPGGQVLIVGGRSDPFDLALSTAELFDPTTGRFQATGSMSTGRAGHVAVLLPSGKVLIAGGANGHPPDAADDPPWDPLDSEIYDPGTGTFRNSRLMSTTRERFAAFRGSMGKVFLVGGFYPLQNRHEQPRSPAYAEVYDDGSGAVSSLPAPTGAQGNLAFATLDGQRGLIVGGLSLSRDYSQRTYFADAVLLDLTSGAFTSTGRLVNPRADAVATTLLDGRVLVTGGYDESGFCLRSAEIYE